MYRHNPLTKALGRLVWDGAIGALRTVGASSRFAVEDPADIPLSSEFEGGALMGLASYAVNGARLLAGVPERVFAEQIVGPRGVDERDSGQLAFARRVTAQFDVSTTAPYRAVLEVAGDAEALAVPDPWLCRGPGIRILRGEGEPERAPIEQPVSSYRLELEHLSRTIRGEVQPLLGQADAARPGPHHPSPVSLRRRRRTCRARRGRLKRSHACPDPSR